MGNEMLGKIPNLAALALLTNAQHTKNLRGGAIRPPDRNRVNPRPDGPRDYPRTDGGGVFEHPPPTISAPIGRREKIKTAFDSSSKTITNVFRSIFGSDQNLDPPGAIFQKKILIGFSRITLTFCFKDRAILLSPLCFSRQAESSDI